MSHEAESPSYNATEQLLPGMGAIVRQFQGIQRAQTQLLAPSLWSEQEAQLGRALVRGVTVTFPPPLGNGRPSGHGARPRPRVERSATDRLADTLASELRQRPAATIAALAQKYRGRLTELGHLREWSGPETAMRRMQEFLAAHVYGERLNETELSVRIRKGRETGGGRRSSTARGARRSGRR